MPILVLIIIALGVGIYLFFRFKRESGGNWVAFFSKGKEAGFSFKEVEMLRHLAVQCDLDDPISLFWSQSQLDKCIHAMVRGIKMSSEGEEQGTQDFLSKLYDYRKLIEMNKRSIKEGISNTHQLGEGQVLQIVIKGAGKGTGAFRSQVIRNTNQYLTISRPVNSKNSSAAWHGSVISVYFWKDDDAGYVFDTKVLDEIYSKGISSLKIAHNDKLQRTQKRNSIRIKIHKAAFLYLAEDGEPPHKLELDPGLKCFLDDLSDTGCAAVVGGKADAGLRVKVQFALDDVPICMTGTVRSTTYNEETNRSLLHIEAEALPMEMRNHILGEVFGTVTSDDEGDLPFRVLDDEAASIGAQGISSNAMSDDADSEGREAADF